MCRATDIQWMIYSKYDIYYTKLTTFEKTDSLYNILLMMSCTYGHVFDIINISEWDYYGIFCVYFSHVKTHRTTEHIDIQIELWWSRSHLRSLHCYLVHCVWIFLMYREINREHHCQKRQLHREHNYSQSHGGTHCRN